MCSEEKLDCRADDTIKCIKHQLGEGQSPTAAEVVVVESRTRSTEYKRKAVVMMERISLQKKTLLQFFFSREAYISLTKKERAHHGLALILVVVTRSSRAEQASQQRIDCMDFNNNSNSINDQRVINSVSRVGQITDRSTTHAWSTVRSSTADTFLICMP